MTEHECAGAVLRQEADRYMADLVGFDRAADFYDETRDLDPAARRTLTDVLFDEVKDKACLEVGIGTGLVGLVLSRRGVSITGADLSARMLQKLAAKFHRPGEMNLARADATAQPFRSASFDAVLSSQMLHLVDRWRVALEECIRVVRPGGVILIDLGNEPDSGWGGPWREVSQKFWEYAQPAGHRLSDVWTDGVVEAELRGKGWEGRSLKSVTAVAELSLGDIIDRLDRGLWSACWTLPEAERHEAAQHARVWASSQFGDLDRKFRIARTITWHAYTAVSGKSEDL